MNITFNPQINFKAKCLAKPSVLKQSPFSSQRVCLVEINPNSTKDVNAVNTAVLSWEGDCFGGDIAASLKTISNRHQNPMAARFFALTTQSENHAELKSSQILGLAELHKKSKRKIELKYLQVKPEHTYREGNKGFLNIGRVLVKTLLRMNKNRSVVAKSAYFSTGFYEKLKFDLVNPDELLYMWRRAKIK